MNNSTKKSPSFLSAMILAGMAFFALLPIMFYMHSCLQPNPPRPEITYGEFPFRVEYEINGAIVVVEDTIICKFDGFDVSWGGDGKTRKWAVFFASGRTPPIFKSSADLVVDDVHQLYFSLGNAEYYMGDVKYQSNSLHAFKATKQLGSWQLKTINQSELLNTYGIKVISWEFTDPIVNTFK
ncbi:MAG: hypothetical protein FWF18_04295 [Dehalococcoidia bacterium]|nr:hypothetical protein [Dehalococcoidia bacterium]